MSSGVFFRAGEKMQFLESTIHLSLGFSAGTPLFLCVAAPHQQAAQQQQHCQET